MRYTSSMPRAQRAYHRHATDGGSSTNKPQRPCRECKGIIVHYLGCKFHSWAVGGGNVTEEQMVPEIKEQP